MKTKEEIREKIKEIKELRKTFSKAVVFDPVLDKPLLELMDAQVRILQWVLGLKDKPRYWCTICHINHEGTKCPECGDGE